MGALLAHSYGFNNISQWPVFECRYAIKQVASAIFRSPQPEFNMQPISPHIFSKPQLEKARPKTTRDKGIILSTKELCLPKMVSI